MPGKPDPKPRTDPSFIPLMRRLVLEVLIYAPLVAIYFLIVLQFGKEPIVRLFHETPVMYAFTSILLIIGQSVLLVAITSWLLRRIGLR